MEATIWIQIWGIDECGFFFSWGPADIYSDSDKFHSAHDWWELLKKGMPYSIIFEFANTECLFIERRFSASLHCPKLDSFRCYYFVFKIAADDKQPI